MDMSRSYSVDLRGRVLVAILEDLSTRKAAKRFRIGGSTTGKRYRSYRTTGEASARILFNLMVFSTRQHYFSAVKI